MFKWGNSEAIRKVWMLLIRDSPEDAKIGEWQKGKASYKEEGFHKG